MHFFTLSGSLIALLYLQQSTAIELDVNNQNSLQNAAKAIAGNIITTYNITNENDIGTSADTSSWWTTGAALDALVKYWFLSGDSQYNDQVSASLLIQQGPNFDYMPPNQTRTEGNDDQATWALATMSAAERVFPASAGQFQWDSLAANVWNDQMLRWDNSTCNGGLRWQIFTFNNGYNYKNSFSNGLFFQLSARLAEFTNNQTYADWAEKAYTWMQTVGLITDDYSVWDGSDATQNCSQFNHIQWSENLGAILYGSAVMYSFTNGTSQQSTWQNRTQGLLKSAAVWWDASSQQNNSTNILYEAACEPQHTCDAEQTAYKGLLAEALTETAVYAPMFIDQIAPVLQASALGAAQSCSGPQNACGTSWRDGKYDGTRGLGQELAALSVVQANLVPFSKLANPRPTEGNGTSSAGGNGSSASTGTAAAAGPSGTSSSSSIAGGVKEVSGLLTMGAIAIWFLVF